MALHLSHAEFVRDAGGQFLQVIDEKPKGRPVGRDDYKRARRDAATPRRAHRGDRRAAGLSPPHEQHRRNAGGDRGDPAGHSRRAAVGLLFDIAHYQQGGGDPVAFIRQYGKAIKVVHLKDVRRIEASPGYQWVELGRGRVDVKGCVAALQGRRLRRLGDRRARSRRRSRRHAEGQRRGEPRLRGQAARPDALSRSWPTAHDGSARKFTKNRSRLP